MLGELTMGIFYEEKTRTYHLKTPNTSYIFRFRGDYILEHLYYGKKIDDTIGIETYCYDPFVSGVAEDSEYFVPGDSFISSGATLNEYSYFGSCDLRLPGFHATYEDGSRVTKMKYVSHKIYKGKPKLPALPATYVEKDSEADTLEIKMADEISGLVIIYRYTVFNTVDAITRNVEVINEGKAPVKLDRIMSTCFDFEDHDFEIIHQLGAWGRECYLNRDKINYGVFKREGRGVCRTHGEKPFFALVRKNTTEEAGDAYGFSLVYSGNFEFGTEVDRYGATRAFMGIGSFDFSWVLEKGETFVTPEAVMVYSSEGIGEMSRTYHQLFRTRLARGKWRDLERPILINNWEATYFKFTEDKIVTLARQAKKAGIEMLVLDDGWFGKRDDEDCSLGDWYPDKKKLPNGIKGIVDKVNAEGLKFGLWVEPEMISPDSDLYRAHPDWCLHVKDRGRSLQRNQLVLDFSRKEVCDYILGCLCDILMSANIEYIKWDVNRDVAEIGSLELPPEKQGETAHRYTLGLYYILENLVTAFPDLLFEGCAGGGGRFDPGMMYYFNQYWTSDNTDGGDRMLIQHGTSMIMPSCFMTAHVSAVPNHQVDRVTSMNTRGLVAMGGQFGYELDISDYNDEQLAEINQQIKLYKSVREVIHKGKMYRLKSPFESNHAVWEYISEDEKTVVVLYFRVRAVPGFERTMLKLNALSKDSKYKLRSTGMVYSGEALMNYGICSERKLDDTDTVMRDYSGKILIFDKE